MTKLLNKKEDILQCIRDFKYYIIYYFDRLKFGQGNVEPEFDIENINEAFLFDEDKCLHIYREDGIKGLLYIYDDADEVLIEEQITKKGKEFQALEKLIVKKIVKYDDDGQAYIERVLPSKLIFNKEEI